MAISDELRINKSVKGLPSTDWLAGKIEKYVEKKIELLKK